MAILNIGTSAVATGTADVITATYSPAITLSDRRIVFLLDCVPNLTTTPTFNPNSLGAQVIKSKGNVALKVGEIKGGCILVYHTTGTYWELLFSQLTRSTLAQILANGITTGGNAISGDNGNAYTLQNNTESSLNWSDNEDGFVRVGDAKSEISHTLLVELDAPNVNLPQETASRVLTIDASKNIKSSTVTTTTLGFLDATSSIQTQLNGKQASGSYLTSANIVETITNGVTTNAPSENAVFDALALKPKIELMFGTTTVFSPADSTTTYVTIATNLAVNTNASLRQFQGISGTIYGFWAYADPQAIIGSSEAVTYNLRNVTDSTSSLLGTLTYDARGRSVLMDVATPIVLDASKFYSIELVFPAFGTNPTNVATLGKVLIR